MLLLYLCHRSLINALFNVFIVIILNHLKKLRLVQYTLLLLNGSNILGRCCHLMLVSWRCSIFSRLDIVGRQIVAVIVLELDHVKWRGLSCVIADSAGLGYALRWTTECRGTLGLLIALSYYTLLALDDAYVDGFKNGVGSWVELGVVFYCSERRCCWVADMIGECIEP